MVWIGICAMAFILTGLLPCQMQRTERANDDEEYRDQGSGIRGQVSEVRYQNDPLLIPDT
jgi:hypothetical protein